MFILIKQVLKSLKQSAILIIALIFICAITIFTSFSALYINSNIDDSLTKIRTQGNSSNVIVNKKYNDEYVDYIYDTSPDKTNVLNSSTGIAGGAPSLYVSNYKYDLQNVDNNIIFPYSTSDFSGPNVNDLWTLPADPNIKYYDEFLPRYANRKRGINRGLSSSLSGVLKGNGAAINIGAAITSWLGIGYSMTNSATGEKLFDPQYLLFSGNDLANKKIVGYFNDGNVQDTLYASESAFIPKIRNFVATDIGVAKLPNLALHKNIIRNIKLDDNSPYSENTRMSYDFVKVLSDNVKQIVGTIDKNTGITDPIISELNVYDIALNTKELTGINKFIFDQIMVWKNMDPTLLSSEQRKIVWRFDDFNLGGTQLPIWKAWTDDYIANNKTSGNRIPTLEDATSFFLANRSAQIKENFRNFVNTYRDYFIKEYLFSNGYELNNNRSFSFYDRDSKKNLLISEKNSNIDEITNKQNDWINKLVLSNGSSAFLNGNNFKIFLDIAGNFFIGPYPIISPTKIDLEKAFFTGIKYYLEIMLNSVPSGNATALIDWSNLLPTIQYIYDNLTFNSNGEIILPQSTDPALPGYLMPGMIQKMFAWIYEPTFFNSVGFNNYNVRTTFKEGVSTITSVLSFNIPNFSSYQVIVTDKFLSEFNKEIIPQSVFNDLQKKNYTEFNEALNNNASTFFIDEKYKIEIGNQQFIITGSGISPEMIYPSPSLSSIIINPSNDILLYFDKYGYDTIRNLYAPSAENNYFAIDVKQSRSFTNIDIINEILMPIMNGGKEKVCYSISNIFAAESILSLRYSFPDIIKNYIFIFSIIALVGLTIIGLYLSFIIMKKYIDKNRVQIALCKANGFSTFKLALGLSSISVIVAVFGGTIGYLMAFFLQQLIYSIVSPYMFIPILFHFFSPIGFIGGIIIIALLFFVFVYINLYLLFKKPINLIIAQNIEIKSNKLLNILKYSKLPMTANLKFKFAISMSNIPRTFFYLTSCFIGITVISFGLSFVSKFDESQELTALNKNYVYSIDLQSPNEQSGLFKSQDYSQLGFSNRDLGIVPIYDEKVLLPAFPYLANTLKVLNIDGTQKYNAQGEPLYFSNIILPSYELYNVFNNEIDIFRNAVFSKWILDFDIPLLGVNVWNTVKNAFPIDLVARIEAQNKLFINAILATPIIGDEFKTFAKLVGDTYQLDGNKILSKAIGMPTVDVLSPAFITFIGKVYGNEQLSNLDVKLSYGSLGYEKKDSETYTYIDALFSDKYLLGKNDNKSIRINGINPMSKFVTLKNNDKQFIGNKLNIVHPDGKTKYIIINNGASLKYGLSIGEKINFSIQNSYFRNSENIFNSYFNQILPNQTNTLFNNGQTFEIIDIASTSFGEEFFVSQKDANEILGLNKGYFIPKINKIGPPPGTHPSYETIPISYTVSADYVPFNGLYSSNINPIILSNALSYYSFINLYGNFSTIESRTDGLFYRKIENSDINLIIEAITPREQILFTNFNDLIKKLFPNNTNIKSLDWLEFKKEILRLNGSTPLIIDFLLKNFGSEGMTISLMNFINYNTTQEIYASLVSTLTLIQNLLVSVIIPLVALIILIMSSIMLEEIKKMIFVFKTLGYSDRQNIFNIIFNFVPIYLISIAVGFLITFLLFLSMQYLIYFLTAIFISSSVNVLNWVYSCAAILGIIFINIIFTIILYKKDKLSDVMKNNF